MEADELLDPPAPRGSNFMNVARERNKETNVEEIEKEPLELALDRLNKENKAIREAVGEALVYMTERTQDDVAEMSFNDLFRALGSLAADTKIRHEYNQNVQKKLDKAVGLLKDSWAFVSTDLTSAQLAGEIKEFTSSHGYMGR